MSVVALWSAPRARSTAFYRSMVERGDMLTLHEPFWELQAFGETEVDGHALTSQSALLTWLHSRTDDLAVFTKDTTDHRFEEVLGDEHFLATARHIFLIRRPEEIAASYYALWPKMRIEEVGLETMYELFVAVTNAGGHQPVVIDSDDLVARPAATVAAFCSAVDLPYIDDALSWQPGERSDWQRSAPWHVEVSASSGFGSHKGTYETTVENSEQLARYAAHHLPFYQRLYAHRLDVSAPPVTPTR